MNTNLQDMPSNEEHRSPEYYEITKAPPVAPAYAMQPSEDADHNIGFDFMEDEYKRAINNKAKKDMIFGALWCVGGTIATVAQTGFIFWGAIIFGGIQFFRGAASYRS